MSDNTIAQNLHKWDRQHRWQEHGDEWKGQAERCGKPYEDWKRSLIDSLILPHTAGANVLEIAPGHGRWSEAILTNCKHLWLVDLSPTCIDHCRERFRDRAGQVDYYVTDGKTLPAELSGRIDFVWSFDAFVHMGADTIASYLQEIQRVLAPGGRAIVHHAGRRDATLWLGWLRQFRGPGRLAYRAVSMGLDEVKDGWRSNVSARLFGDLAGRAGLEVERQMTRWAPGYGVPRFGDAITVMRKR
jgi:SAM-dependent methyltransferase